MINVEKIKPTGLFTNYIYKAIPLAFDESMSYYETLCGLLSYLKDTIMPALNNNADAIIELQELYTQLDNYVKHYFDNLDVQEEINNKLDEMAENGQLADIIAQYLNLAGVLAYNTLNDLKNAENVVNGSICKTLGNVTYNDGYGAFYKVRTITNNDVIDNINIIKINTDNTLIAELITNSNNGTLQNEINEINERITNLNRKKYVFMGDSYGDGFSPNGNVTSWITLLAQKMNLSNDDYISSHYGGVGFSTNRPDYNFINLLNNLTNDNELTDMYVCGGYNDQGETESNIVSGISNFYTLFRTKFPNAKLHIGFIGWSKNSDKIIKLRNVYIAYRNACNTYNIDLMNGCEYSLHNYFKYFSSDGIHPNQDGQTSIANALYNCITSGNANVVEYEKLYVTDTNLGVTNAVFDMILKNGNISITNNQTSTTSFIFSNEITITGNVLTEIGTITNGLIVGTDKHDISFNMPCVVAYSGSTYGHEILNFVFQNGKLYIGCPHASGGAYTSITAKSIQVVTFSAMFEGLSC